MFSRGVICKNCGFKGVIEAHDTKDLPKETIFELLGKDIEGYIHFRCPACGTDISVSPTAFVNPLVKIVGILILGAIIYGVIKLIFH